jgi:hypothetical protein
MKKKLKLRLAIWALFAAQFSFWILIISTHQAVILIAPGFVVVWSVLLVVTLLVLELSILVLPKNPASKFVKLRITLSTLIFLLYSVAISNPFDTIPQSRHIIREPYWDLFAFDVAVAVLFWILAYRRTKSRGESSAT